MLSTTTGMRPGRMDQFEGVKGGRGAMEGNSYHSG